MFRLSVSLPRKMSHDYFDASKAAVRIRLGLVIGLLFRVRFRVRLVWLGLVSGLYKLAILSRLQFLCSRHYSRTSITNTSYFHSGRCVTISGRHGWRHLFDARSEARVSNKDTSEQHGDTERGLPLRRSVVHGGDDPRPRQPHPP